MAATEALSSNKPRFTFQRDDWERRWRALSPNARLGVMAGAAALLALIAMLWLSGGQTSDQVLYANLSDKDGGQVIAELQKLNIPFKVSDGGTVILVPGNVVYTTRMKLAAAGLPHGEGVGFDLLDHEPMGTSDFVEHVNYQRALEGSLERTIASLSAVEHARVHLAIPKPSVFLDQESAPTASVMVTLYPGRQLDAAQVAGIVHLVAASVPGLTDHNVTIVDQHGDLLSSQANQNAGLQPTQLAYQQTIDHEYQQRILSILAPIVGKGGARVAVSADIDFGHSESSSITYGKGQVLSQQSRVQSSTGDAGGPYGVPGALSNQPPGVAVAPLTAPVVSTLSPAALIQLAPTLKTLAPTQSSSDNTTNYDVDKTIVHSVQGGGTIKRVSVAVLVDDRVVTSGKGQHVQSMSPAQLQQIQQLVEDAIGYSAQRGDSVKVVNMPFTSTTAHVQGPWWEQTWFLSLAHGALRYLAGLFLVFFLYLGLVRPLLRTLRQRRSAPSGDMAAASSSEGGQSSPSSVRSGDAGAGPTSARAVDPELPESITLPADPLKADLYVARQLVMQDSARAAQVVKEWLSGEQRS